MRRGAIVVTLVALAWLMFLGCAKDDGNGTGPSPTTYGSIYVESTPTGASVYLDGASTGETTPTTLTNVTVGNHTVKLSLESYVDWTNSVYVEKDALVELEATLSQYSLTIYWPIAGSERVDSAWGPKDSLIQLEARDQYGYSVTGVTWHTSDNTVVSVSSAGYVYGLKDWFDNGNSQPEATVYATKNGLTSNTMVVQTVVNLTGEWRREGDNLRCYIETSHRLPAPDFPIYNPGRVYVWGLQPIGAFIVLGDSIYWRDNDSDSWASGHILENGMRVEYYMGYGDSLSSYLIAYQKND